MLILHDTWGLLPQLKKKMSLSYKALSLNPHIKDHNTL